jgi:hypothetical protein
MMRRTIVKIAPNPSYLGKGYLTFSKLRPLTLFWLSLRSGVKLKKLRECKLLANL